MCRCSDCGGKQGMGAVMDRKIFRGKQLEKEIINGEVAGEAAGVK